MPPAVPSVRQSSVPWIGSEAEKTMTPPTVPLDRNDEGKGPMATVPALVPSVFQRVVAVPS